MDFIVVSLKKSSPLDKFTFFITLHHAKNNKAQEQFFLFSLLVLSFNEEFTLPLFEQIFLSFHIIKFKFKLKQLFEIFFF